MAQDVDHATGLVRRMGDLVEQALRGGVRALRDRDRVAAAAVIAGDDEIDRLENEVWEFCPRLLARYQPLARDLRRVVTLMQVSSELERAADLAQSLAERALRLLSLPPVPEPARLGGMADRAVGMARRATDSFLREDAAAARAVLAEDVLVDADNAAIIAALLAQMKSTPHDVEPCLSLFSAVRHLERVADHATNVAEYAVFLAEGTVLRHRAGRPAVA
jgi:phosphate transport system protein